MTRRTVFRNVTIVTMNDLQEVVFGDLMVEGDRIRQVGGPARARTSDKVIDGAGLVALPGLVQAHVHLTQTLFRNHADDLPLLDWLRLRIWPFEATHDEKSSYASARLGIAELLSGGTTAILDMGTVHHHDEVFRAAEEGGIRYLGGKAMMDLPGEGLPQRLLENTRGSLEQSAALARRWHGKGGGRLRYAYCPRFVVSCTDELLAECAKRARELGTPVHVHASESLAEVELVRSGPV